MENLTNPDDWVRQEIAVILERDIPVIPILIKGAKMPKEEDLPEPLKQLAFHQSIVVGEDPDFHEHVNRIIVNLEEWLK